MEKGTEQELETGEQRNAPDTAASMASFLWSARMTTGPSNSGSPRRAALGPASPSLRQGRQTA